METLHEQMLELRGKAVPVAAPDNSDDIESLAQWTEERGYSRLATEVNAVRLARALAELDIPVLPRGDVERYKAWAVEHTKQRKRLLTRRQQWFRVYLAEYKHPIPLDALRLVPRIDAAMGGRSYMNPPYLYGPEVRRPIAFCVDALAHERYEIAQQTCEPFLVVAAVGSGTEYYLAVWDEPGFASS